MERLTPEQMRARYTAKDRLTPDEMRAKYATALPESDRGPGPGPDGEYHRSLSDIGGQLIRGDLWSDPMGTDWAAARQQEHDNPAIANAVRAVGEGVGHDAANVGRVAAQGATFNYSDEAIAGVRSMFGEEYANALKDERSRLQEGHDAAGPVGSLLLEGAGSLALPAGPIAQAVRRLAGPGAGLLRTAGAQAAVMAPLGGMAAVGAMNDKSDPIADAGQFAKGAAVTGGLAGGLGVLLPAVASTAAATGRIAADVPRQAIEYIGNRGNTR